MASQPREVEDSWWGYFLSWIKWCIYIKVLFTIYVFEIEVTSGSKARLELCIPLPLIED